MTVAAGVDACRGGWVAVLVEDGRFAGSLLEQRFEPLLDLLASAAAIGVDIPIGLPADVPRAADLEARRFVGPRRSSVFPTPTREALAAATYAEARLAAPWLSAQSFAIGPKILEVDACFDDRVFEVHPEVSFAALAGTHLSAKRSWNGQMERRRLLGGVGLELPEHLAAGDAAVDDVLDAAAAAWSAARKARGEAKTLPEDPPIQDGRAVAIWY